MKTLSHLIFGFIALGMLIYAVPKLHVGEGLTLPTVFAIVWLCLAITVIASHLHEILRVDTRAPKELKQIKQVRSSQF
jgi:hypothetical protein